MRFYYCQWLFFFSILLIFDHFCDDSIKKTAKKICYYCTGCSLNLFNSACVFRLQLARDKKSLEEKLQETQSALEGEENKSKTEHRSRLKLESGLQDTEEKLDREGKVAFSLREGEGERGRGERGEEGEGEGEGGGEREYIQFHLFYVCAILCSTFDSLLSYFHSLTHRPTHTTCHLYLHFTFTHTHTHTHTHSPMYTHTHTTHSGVKSWRKRSVSCSRK